MTISRAQQLYCDALPLKEYIRVITDVGFGTVEIRAKRPYRTLAQEKYTTDKLVYIESVEICAIKEPLPEDGPCVFTGRTAIYYGDQPQFEHHKGQLLSPDQPLAVCEKTAANLEKLKREDIFVFSITWCYDGGICC